MPSDRVFGIAVYCSPAEHLVISCGLRKSGRSCHPLEGQGSSSMFKAVRVQSSRPRFSWGRSETGVFKVAVQGSSRCFSAGSVRRGRERQLGILVSSRQLWFWTVQRGFGFGEEMRISRTTVFVTVTFDFICFINTHGRVFKQTVLSEILTRLTPDPNAPFCTICTICSI